MSIAQYILQTFRNNWPLLTWEKQRHFAYRAGLITGEGFWNEAFHKTMPRTQNELATMSEFDRGDRVTYGKNNPRFPDPWKPNDHNKQILYERFPELIYWGDYLNHCRYRFLSVNERAVLSPMPSSQLEELTILIFNPSIFRAFPSWSIECLTDLRWQYGLDKTSLLKELFNSSFTSIQTDSDLWNRWYALTHVVIGESRYYTQKVSSNHWALTLLIKDFQKSGARLSADIAAELGVCFHLGSQHYPEAKQLITQKIVSGFDQEMGMITEGEQINLNLLEHRNILAIMSLMNWRISKKQF